VFTWLPNLHRYTWRVEDPATGETWAIVLDAAEYLAVTSALDARPWREHRAHGGGYLYRLAVETLGREPTTE
jgi:hypothetical protein